MISGRIRRPSQWLQGVAHVAFHVGVILLSAGIALSLPMAVRFLARSLLTYWSSIESERVFLVSIEVTVAVLVVPMVYYARRAWRHRRLAGMAAQAGMISCVPGGLRAQRQVRRLKLSHGFARDVRIVCSTGSSTFVEPTGDLHQVLKHCRTAQIMLLNPYSTGAEARTESAATGGDTGTVRGAGSGQHRLSQGAQGEPSERSCEALRPAATAEAGCARGAHVVEALPPGSQRRRVARVTPRGRPEPGRPLLRVLPMLPEPLGGTSRSGARP